LYEYARKRWRNKREHANKVTDVSDTDTESQPPSYTKIKDKEEV